jgi:hypothetical protein
MVGILESSVGLVLISRPVSGISATLVGTWFPATWAYIGSNVSDRDSLDT